MFLRKFHDCCEEQSTVWAQWVGEVFPMPHALRIARGLLPKGNSFAEIAPELRPIAVFTLAVTVIAIFSYRETLD